MATPLTPNEAENEPKARQAWDKEPDESQLWYDRFITYLGLGSSRTIEETYRQRKAVEKGLTYDRPNSDWHRKARTYNWEERASAYDRDRQQKWLDQEESRRLEARETRREIIGEVLDHVYDAILIADLPNLDRDNARRHLPTLRAMLHDILMAHRLEMGEPTEIQANTTTSVQFSADDLAEAQRQLEQMMQSPGATTPPTPPADAEPR